MKHYLSNPTNRHEPDLADEVIAGITKKAVARVRRREVVPLRKAIELAIIYIEDHALISAKEHLERSLRDLKQIQKEGRHE